MPDQTGVMTVGIIPARAGFTTSRPPPSLPRRDHPRSRGVYHPHPVRLPLRRGSSPLARGLRRADVLLAVGVRIIPARAGFTETVSEGVGDRADHPRSRGVYRVLRDLVREGWGSSPLARGLLDYSQDHDDAVRIIPARAGFTRVVPDAHGHAADHPRSRGVYAASGSTAITAAGSSPLARGLLPRGLGRAQGAVGSSPLARGLRRSRRRGRRTLGIIPARAGFTARPSGRPRGSTDHPRSRGVYTGRSTTTTRAAGSSPLARGLLPGPANRGLPGRIIPARAGFTRGG